MNFSQAFQGANVAEEDLAATSVGPLHHSPLSQQLLDAWHHQPNLLRRRLDWDALPHAQWLRYEGSRISPWPLFLPSNTIAEHFVPLVSALPDALIRALIARFGRDSRAFSDYFRWPKLVYDLILKAPIQSELLLCRYDVVLIESGAVRVLELNCGAAAGGWQTDWVLPEVARSLRESAGGKPWPAVHRRISERLFKQVIQGIRRVRANPACGSVALFAFPRSQERCQALQETLNKLYERLRPPDWLPGRVVLFDRMEQLTFTPQHDVLVDGTPVEAVLLTFPDAVDIPQHVMDGLVNAHLRGRAYFPDMPTHSVLDSKLMFAVAHEAIAMGGVSDTDRQVIERFIPWTCVVADTEVVKHNQRWKVRDLLRTGREQLVLKRADSFGGKHVWLGNRTAAATWETQIDAAISEGGWIAQTLCVPAPISLSSGDTLAPNDVIWGVFGYGGEYGGVFARAAPSANDSGVVNYSGGASELLVFEDRTQG